MLDEVPTFLRLADALLHGRLVRAVDLAEDKDCPAWLIALTRKLRAYMASYRRTLAQRHGLAP